MIKIKKLSGNSFFSFNTLIHPKLWLGHQTQVEVCSGSDSGLETLRGAIGSLFKYTKAYYLIVELIIVTTS